MTRRKTFTHVLAMTPCRKTPFQHQWISIACRFTLMTGIYKAVGLWTPRETTGIFFEAPIRNSCDIHREPGLGNGHTLPAKKTPPIPLHLGYRLTDGSCIKKWQVLDAEWDLNLNWGLCPMSWVKGIFFLWGQRHAKLTYAISPRA